MIRIICPSTRINTFAIINTSRIIYWFAIDNCSPAIWTLITNTVGTIVCIIFICIISISNRTARCDCITRITCIINIYTACGRCKYTRPDIRIKFAIDTIIESQNIVATTCWHQIQLQIFICCATIP